MTEPPDTPPEEDRQFHTYKTHRIPWYVHAMWIVFCIAAIWYVLRWAIPSVRDYF